MKVYPKLPFFIFYNIIVEEIMENKNDKRPAMQNAKNSGGEDKDKMIIELQKLVDERTKLAQEAVAQVKVLRNVVKNLSALI